MTAHYRKVISINDDPALFPVHAAVLGVISQGSVKGLTQDSIFEILSFLIDQGWTPLDGVEVSGVGAVLADLEVAGVAYEEYSRWHTASRGWTWIAGDTDYFTPRYLYDLWTCSTEWLRRQEPPHLYLSLTEKDD